MPGDPNQYDVLFIEEARWRQYNKDYECDKPSSMIEIHLTPKPNSKVHLVNIPASLDWCYALVMSSSDKCGLIMIVCNDVMICMDHVLRWPQVMIDTLSMVVVDIFIIVHTVDIVQKLITMLSHCFIGNHYPQNIMHDWNITQELRHTLCHIVSHKVAGV